MTSLGQLLLVLATLYLLECVIAVRRDTMIFWCWPRATRITLSQSLPGPVDWGLFLAPPLPPLGRLYQAQFWPISISPAGVSNLCAEGVGRESVADGPPEYVAFDEIQSAESDGPFLRLNGRRFARFTSPQPARAWATLVRDLKSRSLEVRESATDAAIARTMDESRIVQILNSQHRPTSEARLAANMLFALLFVATPLIVIWPGWSRSWPFLLVSLLILWAHAVYVSWRGHRIVYAERRSERRQKTLLAALTPMAAIRGHDAITRHAFWDHHPLAIAFVLCDAQRFRDFAQDVLRDLVHPLIHEDIKPDHPAIQTAHWLRSRLRDACEDWLRRVGVEPMELLKPPEPDDEQCRSYCPRCRGQNVRKSGQCPRCGVTLTPFTIDESGTAARVEPSLANPRSLGVLSVEERGR